MGQHQQLRPTCARCAEGAVKLGAGAGAAAVAAAWMLLRAAAQVPLGVRDVLSAHEPRTLVTSRHSGGSMAERQRQHEQPFRRGALELRNERNGAEGCGIACSAYWPG